MIDPLTPDQNMESSTVSVGESGGMAQALRIISLIGGVLVTLGDFLPWSILWENGYEYTTSAFDGADGAFILGFGLAIGCLAVVRLATTASSGVLWVQAVIAAIVICFAVGDMNSITNLHLVRMQYDPAPDAGSGLWLVLMGGVVATVGCLPVIAASFRGSARMIGETTLLEGHARRFRERD